MINLLKKKEAIIYNTSPLLEKISSHDYNISLSQFYSAGDRCDIALYYGIDQIKADCTLLSFMGVPGHIDIYHPIRSYAKKWEYKYWSGKFIKWSTILENRLNPGQYFDRVIIRDTNEFDLLLSLLSLEHHMPVYSESFCKRYYDGLELKNKRDIIPCYLKLRTPRPHLSENNFLKNLMYIVGRINETKY